MRPIEEVLSRRGDLSTFLVHLTRRSDPGDASGAVTNLARMLHGGVIEARSAYGWGARVPVFGDTQKVVCFSETPLEHINSLFDIQGRQVNLEPYGLMFTKVTARLKGALPVWYVDHRSEQASALTEMMNDAWRGVAAYQDLYPTKPTLVLPVMKVLPFYEVMGSGTRADGVQWRKEFSWEREWRHRGSFGFGIEELALIIAPEAYHPWFQTHYPQRPTVDAGWSLERMIASLAGLARPNIEPMA